MQQIDIVFDVKTGEARVETSGFSGKSCKDATKFLSSLGDASNMKHKTEFYEENGEREGVRKTLYSE